MTAQILIINLLIPFLLSGCDFLKMSLPVTNHNPRIESVIYDKELFAAQENELVCQAVDPDGDSLQYEWTAEKGSKIGTGSRVQWTSPEVMGDYELTVRVTDGKGGETKQLIPVRVLTNADGTTAPPITLILSLTSSEVVTENRTTKVGTATKITCSVKGDAVPKLTYSWSAGGGSMKGKGLENGTCPTVIWTAPPITEIYTVSVSVRDASGNEAKGRVLFDVFCCPRN